MSDGPLDKEITPARREVIDRLAGEQRTIARLTELIGDALRDYYGYDKGDDEQNGPTKHVTAAIAPHVLFRDDLEPLGPTPEYDAACGCRYEQKRRLLPRPDCPIHGVREHGDTPT